MTLKAPPLAAFGRSLLSARHASYVRQIESQQAVVSARIEQTIPSSRIRWRYKLVANGLAVVLPRSQIGRLARVPGVAQVWPNVRYHSLATKLGAAADRRRQALGPELRDGRERDEDRDHRRRPRREPRTSTRAASSTRPGSRKGRPAHDAEGDRAADVRAALADVEVREDAVRPDARPSTRPTSRASPPACTDVQVDGNTLSGVAPNAYIGNYKALTIPTPGFGLDGNSAEIAAAIDAAVADGMDVINLSLGEPEVEPSRDLVVKAIEGAAAAGVVPVIAAATTSTTSATARCRRPPTHRMRSPLPPSRPATRSPTSLPPGRRRSRSR